MEALDRFLEELGVDIYGYADLQSFESDSRDSLPFGISFGIAIDKEIIKKIPQGPFMDYVDAYSSITDRLDDISHMVVSFLKEKGYFATAQDRAYVGKQIEESKNETDNVYGKALMPHKTVAAVAGLGWITKSALLITEQFGSAIRFGSVLTDAPLIANSSNYQCKCGDCKICAASCPTGAILGVTWSEDRAREELIDYSLCQESFRNRSKLLEIPTAGGTCGICIAVCPYTASYLRSTI